MPLGKVTIDWDGRDLLIRLDPFRVDVIEQLKSVLPPSSRTWDIDVKAWRVNTHYFEKVCAVFEKWDYAIRDFTGDDKTAKIRQAAHRIHREEIEAKAAAKAKRQEAETAAREAKQEEWEKADQKWKEFFLSEREWEARFNEVWPDALPSDFGQWWYWFNQYGRENANIFYNNLVEKRKEQAQRKQDNWRRQSQRADSSQEREDWYEAFGYAFRRNGSTSGRSRFEDFGRAATAATIAPESYRILGVNRGDSYETVKAAYRKAAFENHPDRGGKVEDMTRINNAFDNIKREKDWK